MPSACPQDRLIRDAAAGAAALAILLLVACGRPTAETEIDLLSPDQVSFQTGNVSTDLMSASAGRGLERLEYGIWPVTDEGGDGPVFEIVAGTGRLSFFSADGDAVRLDIETRARNLPGAVPLRLWLRLNQTKLEMARVGPEWSVVSFDLPADLIRRGRNILELRPHPGKKQKASGATIRVRSLRFASATGRSYWPDRNDEIVLEEQQSPPGESRVIRVPNAGFFEAVALVPPEARLVGRVRGGGGPSDGSDRISAYVSLMDEQGETRVLWSKDIRGSSSRSRNLAVRLEPWAGQVARLRLGVTGTGNGVVEWHDARILGDRDEEPWQIDPILPSVPPRSARLGRPDVFVILLDAARADAFAPWGGPHPTPAVERLAAEGTTFSRALAASPWTGQSVSSIMTGYYADALGVGPWGSPLPATTPTIAELLAGAGYHTVLWTQHPFYKQQRDLQRGFATVEFGPFGDHGALPSLDDHLVQDRSNFAFIHLLPPHAEYDPPAPFRGKYSSWYDGDVEPTAAFLNGFPDRRDPESLSPDDLRYIFDRYLENAAWADSLVGDLLAQLDRLGRYRNALVMVLSDHGEAFLEHGFFLHSKLLYDEFLHVPLVIKWPRGTTGARSRWEPTVSLVDVVPTLVDGLDLGSAGDRFQGRSLLPGAFEGGLDSLPIYAVTRGVATSDRRPRPSVMLEIDGWKLIHDQLGMSSRLFRPTEDPGEQKILAASAPREALLLERAVLRQSFINRLMLETSAEATPLEEMDPEVEERLRALGYLD